MEVPYDPPTSPCAADCGLKSIWHRYIMQFVSQPWSSEETESLMVLIPFEHESKLKAARWVAIRD
jgi:hypothetical protein